MVGLQRFKNATYIQFVWSLTFLSDFHDERLFVSQKLHIPPFTLGDVLIDVVVSCKTGCIRIIWKIMFCTFCAII